MQYYNVFLGYKSERNYQENIQHLQDIAYCLENVSTDEYSAKKILEKLNKKEGNSLFQIELLSTYYSAKASLNLVIMNNLNQFKADAYIAAKLYLLSRTELLYTSTGLNTFHFFTALMSDSPALISYLVNNRNIIAAPNIPYEKDISRAFLNATTLVALAGEWGILQKRCKALLDDTHKDKKYILEYEFLFALSNANVSDMELVLNKMLELKLAKKMVHDTVPFFDFYLQVNVLLLAKIASIHGFHLNIDEPIAPKELINYSPLEKYDEPYDFMKEFKFDELLENWIKKWKSDNISSNNIKIKRKFNILDFLSLFIK
ncbi:MAG: Imm49 family immunity protein [[Pasteurella] mairii]|uniref:Uncharacterized protein n=1 Tax=[Pasteurella] mairii TaxID=757 RepID=A0A379B6Q3_9PAST|nr:Imm49 family immunity protein [[Pasteurella] mairii]SUB34303.1 Uncharacterised protein [[Pasteurella] mairii]